tara:strand:+ start:189 stop:797 length:609 start_codon:yes stop_codon:yes gene_type:complete
MSCGPSKALRDLAGQIDELDNKVDDLIAESPLGKLADLQNQAKDAIGGVMNKVEAAIPEALNKVLGEMDKTLHEDASDLLKFIMLGAIAKPQLENKLDSMKKKWGSVDLGDIKDLDDLADLIRNGAIDLDSICKMLPNVEGQGVDLVVKGRPISFPDISPEGLLKGHGLPDIKKGNVWFDVGRSSRRQSEEFFNLEIPEFDW